MMPPATQEKLVDQATRPGHDAPVMVETATRQDTIEALLKKSKRDGTVGIRQAFLQRGRGSKAGAGPLATFVKKSDAVALDAYLLLLLLGRGKRYGGHYVTVQAGTWVRALGLAGPSSGQRLSRALFRLEAMRLIRRARTRKGVRIELLKEDGGGRPYTPPAGSEPDLYFRLPFDYWAEDRYLSLRMPAKAMLLVALGEAPEFELPVSKVKDYYGFSQETAQRGLEELVRAQIARFDMRIVKDALDPDGQRQAKFWHLLGPYARAQKESVEVVRRIRRIK